ncbi:MAG: hypothetical protein IPK82_43310 [Polyangiaceae bacterium]|nr:hypothetical protein [Polyangiaceae bacterium]
MRLNYFILPVAAVVALGCGARSELLPSDLVQSGTGGSAGDSSSSGPGGSTGSTSTTSSTNLPKCGALQIDGQALTPELSFPGLDQASPWVVPTASDGNSVALAYYEDIFFSSPYLQMGSVAIEPWGVWPKSLGSTAPHLLTSGFVAGNDEKGRFSLLAPDDPNLDGMVAWSAPAGMGGAEGQFFPDMGAGLPMFVAHSGDWYLTAFQVGIGGGLAHVHMARVAIGATKNSIYPSAGCGINAAHAGAAVPLENGFLAAFSNGQPYGSCLTDQFAPTLPSRIQVVNFSNSEELMMGKLQFELEEEGTYIYQVKLAKGAGANWVAWERVGLDPQVERRIQYTRLDSQGLPFNGKVTEVKMGIIGTQFAIASLGDVIALSTVVEVPDEGWQMATFLLDDSGNILSQVGWGAEPGFDFSTSVSSLGSPTGDKLVVAWGESWAANNDDQRVRIARIACINAP